jgi:hypothetical protein
MDSSMLLLPSTTTPSTGNFFTGTHPKFITLLDLIDGHLFFYSVLDATSRFRRETQERPDRFPRSIPCLRFQ